MTAFCTQTPMSPVSELEITKTKKRDPIAHVRAEGSPKKAPAEAESQPNGGGGCLRYLEPDKLIASARDRGKPLCPKQVTT